MKNPLGKKGRKLSKNNLKPTKAQLLAEPVTHHLYFKAAQDFYRGKMVSPQSYDLHKLPVDVVTPHGRKLELELHLGKKDQKKDPEKG